MLTDMPNELLDMIIQKLHKKDAISVTSVNSDLRQFYSKYVIRKNIFNVEDLYGDPKIDFKLSDVTELNDVDENSIDLVTSENFPNLKKIKFHNSFNLPVSKYNLPNSLKEIIFGYDYTQLICVKTDDRLGGIPLNVKSLTIPSDICHMTIDGGLRLQCLESVYIHNIWSLADSKGNSILPVTVKHIEIREYCYKLDSYTGKRLLPPFLESLILGEFNRPIVSEFDDDTLLPASLVRLKIENYFNQTIMSKKEEPLLPPNLKYLELSYSFNQSIIAPSGKQLIPASLTELKFGTKFDQPFVDKDGKLAVILPNLNKLELGTCFNQELYDVEGVSVLPKTVTEFIFPSHIHCIFEKSLCNQYGESVFPPNLKILKLPYNFSNFTNFKLPESVEELILGNYFNEPLDSLKLPKLKKLELNSKFNQVIQSENGTPFISDTVEKLDFGKCFNQPVYNQFGKSLLPSSLKILNFGNNFNQPICNFNGESVLPPNLDTLFFGSAFNQPVINDDDVSLIPNTITRLYFGNTFNQEMFILPRNLEVLMFGKNFNKKIGAYPPKLLSIVINKEYKRYLYDRDGSLLFSPLVNRYADEVYIKLKS